jgi:lipooligosaccharide transport system ATP-binding protein
MDEAEQLCDRLVVMDKARIVAEGTPRSLIEEHSRREVVEVRFPIGILEQVGERLEGFAKRVEVLADRALLYTDDAEETVHLINQDHLDPETVLVRRSTLEDVFLRLTGRTLVE